MKKMKCNKCGYEWVPRVDKPKECPNCKQMLKKVIKLSLILFVLLFAYPAQAEYRFAENWTKTDTVYQVSFLTITSMDFAQTRWMARQNWNFDGRSHTEIHPLLSKKPSVSEVDILIPLGMVAHTIIALALPPEAKVFDFKINPRRIWQTFFIVTEITAVGYNWGGGVRMEF